MVRLAYGVVAGRDVAVWAPGPDSVALNVRRHRLAPGAAVVVGPRDAGSAAVSAALGGLHDVVALGGVIAAGAGVDVGPAWRTARLVGCAGDRRDALLAAIRALGAAGVDRLGDRAAVLVALFGPAATKRVGAAATAALHDGRFAPLHLASAASEVLGPEQLERVLGLTGPDGMDREAHGLASVLAGQLDRLFVSLSKPRRLTILLDLWSVVCDQWTLTSRRQRRRDVGGGDARAGEVRARYQHYVDEQVQQQAAYAAGDPVRPADLARWTPTSWHWAGWLHQTMHDALAATVLLRTAAAVADHGTETGIAQVRRQLATAPILFTKGEATQACRPVDGLSRVPARPGAYIRELDARLRPDALIDAKTEAYVRARLVRARDYGVVVEEAARELMAAVPVVANGVGEQWICAHLRQWREAVGYADGRSPNGWEQPPFRHTVAPLAQRLRDQPTDDPASVELPCDLLWYADLADALAQIGGHDRADVTFDEQVPDIDVDPPAPPIDPLRPPEDSPVLAIAGAAQLVDLGAEVPARPRGWRDLVDGLLASTVVAEALTGSFAVPQPLRDRDGATLPGTEIRIEIASDPRQLADWARFMGNCIAGPYYLRAAMAGKLVLAGLRDPDGRLLANLELRAARSNWHVVQLQGRFNTDPDPTLETHVAAWVAGLPPKPSARSFVAPRSQSHAPAHRTRQRTRIAGDVREALVPLVTQALSEDDVVRAVDVLSHAGFGTPSGLRGVVALRRVSDDDLDDAVRSFLSDGTAQLMNLWRASAHRPLASAVGSLEPALRDRGGFVDLLLGDGPLPALPRRLDRVPIISEARSVDIAARRVRRAIGRLARSVDPGLGRQVLYVDTNLLCALVLVVSTGARSTSRQSSAGLIRITSRGDIAVPGYPLSTLDDESGPWRRAASDAAELGAQVNWSRPMPALVVPAGWMGRGGWPALWARTHRTTANLSAVRSSERSSPG